MPDFEIFSGIYGSSSDSVRIFSLDGSLVWKNSTAEASDITDEAVFGIIASCGTESGSLDALGGGRFRTLTFGNEKFFLTELYSGDRLIEAFSAPFFESFVNGTDSNIRRTVTSMASYCQIILDSSDDPLIRECVAKLLNGSSTILRTADLTNHLIVLSDETRQKRSAFKASLLAETIAGGCRRIFGESCISSVSFSDDVLIFGDKSLMLIFVLGLLRRIIHVKKFTLSISDRSDDNFAVMTFSIDVLDNTPNKPSDDEIYEELHRASAVKLGMSYEISDNSLTVTFPRIHCSEASLDISSFSLNYDCGIFSIWDVMLGDLHDFSTNF